MFTRMSFLSGDPSRIDDVVAYAHDTVKPATDRLAGNLGLGAWINRESGDVMVMTVWQDEASLQASEDAVLQLREDAAEMIGGTASVERFETLLVDPTIPHQIGFAMRMLRIRPDPGRIEDNRSWALENVLPVARAQPGYVSYVVAGNRRTGEIASMQTYRDKASAAAALTAMQPIRDAGRGCGLDIYDIRDYEVAIVGIRAPMPSIPVQTTVDLTADQTEAAKR